MVPEARRQRPTCARTVRTTERETLLLAGMPGEVRGVTTHAPLRDGSAGLVVSQLRTPKQTRIMGDRGNVSINQSNGQKLWIYTHWTGSSLPALVRDGLIFTHGRWDDEPYFNRGIISSIIGLDHLEDNTGYGVGLECGDGQNQIVEIDREKETVRIGERTWAFSEYVKLDPEGISF